MAPEKITRKDLLYSPDKFVTTSQKIYQWFLANQKTVCLVGVVILALLIAFSVFNWRQGVNQKRAQAAYEQAYAFMVEGENDKAEATFKALIEDHPKSGPARFAYLDLAAMAQGRKELPAAIEYTTNFLNKMTPAEQSLKPFVLDKLANLLEAADNLTEAAAYYDQLLAYPYMKENALLSLGRVLKAQNNNEKALGMYTVFLAEFPTSSKVDLAVYNIALLKGDQAAPEQAPEAAPEAKTEAGGEPPQNN